MGVGCCEAHASVGGAELADPSHLTREGAASAPGYKLPLSRVYPHDRIESAVDRDGLCSVSRARRSERGDHRRFFGKETVSLKLGREGKKSVEGSIAMLLVCFGLGCTVFAAVELREYPVLIGAVAATLTELYEPLGLNDNLTIPLFSSLAMQWGFARIQACEVPHLRDIAADFRGQYSLHIPSFVYNAPFVGRLADGVGGLLGDAVGLIADYL